MNWVEVLFAGAAVIFPVLFSYCACVVRDEIAFDVGLVRERLFGGAL